MSEDNFHQTKSIYGIELGLNHLHKMNSISKKPMK